MSTPNLSLALLEAAQSQKHVTVNEALVRLDAGVQLSVLDRDLADPPASPEDGDRYLVTSPATGDWLMQENRIAVWDAPAQGWLFLTPKGGWRVWVEDERVLLLLDQGQWTQLGGAQLGVNASADESNRLSVASDAVLFTHDGAGVQAKVNKAGVTHTASLLFQTNYSGRAEVGLTGDDDLRVKTSADGVAFNEAIVVDRESGHTRFPSGASVEGVSLGRNNTVNILPDSGRFGGTATNTDLEIPTFVSPGYLSPYNGSSVSGYGRFVNKTSTYGGTAAALDPEIDALHSLLRPANLRVYGPEWWAMKVTLGSGTIGSQTVGGTTYALSLLGLSAPMPVAHTIGYYIRALSGTAFISQISTKRFARWGVDETGIDASGVVAPADGWVFIEQQMDHNGYGYSFNAFRVYSAAVGDEFLFAMPRLVVGHTALDPYLPGPLLNDRIFG